ncbi:MAG: corrinoid protein [Oscillospiraceae bacterium]|jgi:5-methyltetrahydrofolate--homocysteine methyltransferase|nr:corrinoid protein [Oscillospiraceae bacterium]
MSEVFSDISAALQAGKAKDVKELITKALAEGADAKDILDKGLLAGMDVVAVKFRAGDVFVPEVLISARAMNAGTALLKASLAEAGAKPVGKAVIGTVKGDLHDIGKNLVRMMFEGKGIEVVDLGVDVSPEMFIEACRNEEPDIVAMSALLTTTMGEMKAVVDAFVAEGLRDKVILMVGGAPVSESFRESVGADLYAEDAASAAEAAKRAITQKNGSH